MNEDWWQKLKSETVRDRLPDFFIIVGVGFLSYAVILVLLFIFPPWSHEPKHTSFPVSSREVVTKQADNRQPESPTLP